MKLRRHSVSQVAMVIFTVVAFLAAGHFAANAVIQGQQQRRLSELTEVALRRAEVAIDFGTATLDELTKRAVLNCDPASLQAVRLQVYQRFAVKDIRLVNRDGSVICSAYSETLEFDNGWIQRSDMLPSDDKRLLIFRVDQFSGVALGILRDVDEQKSIVAILGINSSQFDIMPAELRANSEVLLQLNNGSEVVRFSLQDGGAFSHGATFGSASLRYPFSATIRVDNSALGRWDSEAYWPAMCIALGLGMAFGFLLTRATARLEGPIADIDRALARGEFKPFFQPTFDLRTGAILGCEVLARWVRSDGTVVSPMNFIPLAESSGRIEPMTWHLLSTALKELYPRLREDKNFKLSFNVAPRHLVSDGFVETLRRIVSAARVSTRQIVLEITERNEFPDLDKAAALVRELRELGFKVAMDDVGVGHSGLSQMNRLGANTIKIDKFFVDTITQDGSAATIVEMLVRLARGLDMTVLAEGIETSEQLEALIACGVEEGQGYIVSPPLPFAKFDALVESRRSKALAEAAVREAALVA
jgi:sensor c-di-GMP phosphodiesterase-like protein